MVRALAVVEIPRPCRRLFFLPPEQRPAPRQSDRWQLHARFISFETEVRNRWENDVTLTRAHRVHAEVRTN